MMPAGGLFLVNRGSTQFARAGTANKHTEEKFHAGSQTLGAGHDSDRGARSKCSVGSMHYTWLAPCKSSGIVPGCGFSSLVVDTGTEDHAGTEPIPHG